MHKVFDAVLSFVIVQLFFAGICSQGGTNLFYLTYEGNTQPTWTIPTNKDEIAEIVKNPESWPAEYDPAGNWGIPAGGFQLSLRLETNVFWVGQPISVIIVLRNVTPSPVKFREFQVRPNVAFNIVNAQNHPVERIESRFSIHSESLRLVNLGVRWQRKYVFPLHALYELQTAGTYYITAKWGNEVSSETAFFTIIDYPSGNSHMPAKREHNAPTTNVLNLQSSLKQDATDEASRYKEQNPQAKAQSSETQSVTSVIAEAIPESSMDPGSPQNSKYPWRNKLLWATLSFLFLVLAFVFYRAHRRSARQHG